MKTREWQIGVAGTFDVGNYGDLLFPLVAEAELSARLGAVKLHRFSYHGKTPPDWPYRVTSVTELPQLASSLDGLLIGGGFLIRFDKEVAPGYGPPTPEIHHPTGYWLTPALIALQQGIPLIWNAPGMHCNEIPAWADPLMDLALSLSRYVAVRDEPSREALARYTDASRIKVVPDTAFGISRLLDGSPSPELNRLREAAGLTRPYIVIQAALGLKSFACFVKNHAHRFQGFQFLALPVGPVLGDHPAILEEDLPEIVRLPTWPHPLLLAELIGNAEAVVGHSYHLAITALASGVPVFTPQDLSVGKYSALLDFETLYQLDAGREPDPDWFLSRLGRAAPAAAVEARLDSLHDHWNRIAAALEEGPRAPQPALGQFWQSLPGRLEEGETRNRQRERIVELSRLLMAHHEIAAHDPQLTEQRERIDELSRLLTVARQEIAARDQQVAALHHSNSWKLTSPLRFFGRALRGNGARNKVINLDRISQHKLETEPYRWARIDSLFSPKDAKALATTYPHDHFKRLQAHGGEKDYDYEARSLIRMGAETPSFPNELSAVWRGFAEDLLSPAYRNAMSLLTGCDLSNSPLEVNVFHYGPGASLGAHPDLADKIITHVFYFNESWNPKDGGCLSILRSPDAKDIVTEIPPLVGTSAVIVRSDTSWHAVAPVINGSQVSRRSVTVTFYRPGSESSMWPADDATPLHRYGETETEEKAARPEPKSWWSRLTSWGK
ncbi:MAG TPA: polysaccharide pyruvyl transferase family protein [Thermoanaerobaculia bacterium]|nr:polysaccharide pyruvyl transferase family protein [Thermoanaerobaculia bacterium]